MVLLIPICATTQIVIYMLSMCITSISKELEHDLNAFEFSFIFKTLLLYVLCELDFMCY